MNWYKPKTKETDQRRKLIEDLIRTRQIRDVPHMSEILTMEYNTAVTDETIRRDFAHLNATKDPNSGFYMLLDSVITRFDLYLMLRHACTFLLNDVKINGSGDTIFLYPELGTAPRFEYLLEAIRQDEELTPDKTWNDKMLGTLSSNDVVVCYFESRAAGEKFYKKLQVFNKQRKDLTWAENLDEEMQMRKVMDDALSDV